MTTWKLINEERRQAAALLKKNINQRFTYPIIEKVEFIKNQIHVPVIVLSVTDSMPLYMKLGYWLKMKQKKHSFMTWQDFLRRGTDEPQMAGNHAAPAVIVYTSGTTGEPKGVLLCNDGLNAVV